MAKRQEQTPIKIIKDLIEQAKCGNAGLIVISVSTAETVVKMLEEKDGADKSTATKGG